MAEPKVWQIDALAATLLALRQDEVETLLVNARLYIRSYRGDWPSGQEYIDALRESGVQNLVELLHSTTRTLDVAAWLAILYMFWIRVGKDCVLRLVASSHGRGRGRVSSPLPYLAHRIVERCPAEFKQLVCT